MLGDDNMIVYVQLKKNGKGSLIHFECKTKKQIKFFINNVYEIPQKDIEYIKIFDTYKGTVKQYSAKKFTS